jgi:hypothetical protein
MSVWGKVSGAAAGLLVGGPTEQRAGEQSEAVARATIR